MTKAAELTLPRPLGIGAHPMPTPEALTVPEVMAALRLSRSKVYDLLRSGQLRSFRAGRSRRVPTEALRQYIDTRMGEAA